MVILIPLPLFFASTIYGVGSLKTWVIVAILWAFLAAFTVVLYPLWESRVAIVMVTKGIIKVRVPTSFKQPVNGELICLL
jgi:urea-proton symporter